MFFSSILFFNGKILNSKSGMVMGDYVRKIQTRSFQQKLYTQEVLTNSFQVI